MQLIPYLTFNGECEQAFKFYEKCLSGRITFMATFAESPMAEQTPANWRGKIMHATLAIGKQELSGCDPPPGHYRKTEGISILLSVETVAEADRIFSALAQGGTVQMPLQETFWAQRFGTLIDRFGTPWLINCGKSE